MDAETGELAWEVNTTDQAQSYTITGAPRIIGNDRLVIGNGGAEYGVRGYVSAYDTETGEMLWRFYTVPGNPADGFEDETQADGRTRRGRVSGGRRVAVAPRGIHLRTTLIWILSTSAQATVLPWARALRSPDGGDNLFLSSIVAVSGETGEYVWHYQTTPGDTWDYTAVQHLMLADLEIDGAERQVIMQAPKNGFFYVLDRATGELLSAENIVPTRLGNPHRYGNRAAR